MAIIGKGGWWGGRPGFVGRRARPVAELLEARQLLATIVVTSAGDADGADGGMTLSLRQAIEISNGTLAVSALSASQAALVSGGPSTPNTIDFAIPGVGPFVIEPGSALPAITSPVLIDGYSQPGARFGIRGPDQGNNDVILIELDGVNAPGANGLDIQAGHSTVQGLAIGGFVASASSGGGAGILLELNTGDMVQGDFIGVAPSGSVALANSVGIIDMHRYVLTSNSLATIGGFNTIGGSGNVISGNANGGLVLQGGPPEPGPLSAVPLPITDLVAGNLIGTDAAGTAALANGGAGIDDAGGGPSTIGGTAAGAGNVISGNGDGLVVTSYGAATPEAGYYFPSSDLVEGNRIGTDITGTAALANAGAGVLVIGASATVGGTAAGAGNVISGNLGDGLAVADGPGGVLYGGGASVVVQGDQIGVNLAGTTPLPNGGDGVHLTNSTLDDTVGGTDAGAGNVIAFNAGAGVEFAPVTANNSPSAVVISGNSIDSNGKLGINYSSMAFQSPPIPLLSSALATGSGSTIVGTLAGAASTTYTIELFSNASPDPSGSGQGQTYLGTTIVTTDAAGNASFTFTTTTDLLGQWISATATAPVGEPAPGVIPANFAEGTSEFAVDVLATAPVPPPPPTPPTIVELLGDNRVATQGQLTSFSAIVISTAPGTPAGSIEFLEDGLVIGSAPIGAANVATFVTDQLQPGPHVITADYLGDGTHPASTPSNPLAVEVTNATAFGGPSVTSDVLIAPSTVRITFNRGLLTGPAEDLANYTIMGPRNRAVAIFAAIYDPSTASVTLTTFQALDPHQSYRLTINGQKGDRVVDVFGIALNGKSKGKPGHDFAGKIAVEKAPKATHPKTPKAPAKAPAAKVHAAAHRKDH